MNTALHSDKPLIIAHRGASALAPENTMAAFQLALDLGADGIELDVMLSKDKEMVVIHDDTVDRTTNGSGRVGDFSYQTLRDLDAGHFFSSVFRGEHLPSLAEVYKQLGGKLLINVELKNYAAPFDRLTEKVIALTQQFNLMDSVLLSSFNPLNLIHARRQLPAIRLGLLTSPGRLGGLLCSSVGRIFPYDAIHPHFSDVNVRLVDKMHALGRSVNVWTVDEPAELRRLAALGVDAIICNNPQAAREILQG